MKRFDQKTETFIAEFQKDKDRPKRAKRAQYDIQADGSDVYLFLQIDGKTIATHAFIDAAEAWLDFRRDFFKDRLGTTLLDDLFAF